jgi:DNA-binding IscR family transcriptional regulator
MNSDLCVALHALIYLDHKATTLSSEALAENFCTNAARVRKVLAKLKDACDVRTCAGINGGYEFIGNAQKVTLADVVRAIGADFVEMHWKSGNDEKHCRISSGMAGAMDGIIGGLNALCKRHLQKTTIADIEKQLVYGT